MTMDILQAMFAASRSTSMSFHHHIVWMAMLVAVACASLVIAQQPASPLVIPCAAVGQPLIELPVIERDEKTRTLRAVLITADEKRNLWFNTANATGCAPQSLRYFKG